MICPAKNSGGVASPARGRICSVGSQQQRRGDKRVAVHLPVADELGLLQPGDHAQHALLLGVGQVGLEADQIVQRAGQVVLAQLSDRIRPVAGARVVQPHRAHGPVGQGLQIARRHHFHRQAAFEEFAALRR